MSLITLGFVLVAATMLALLLVPLNIRLANALGAIDEPVGRHTHSVNIPRMGGVAIILSFFGCVILFLPIDRSTGGLILGTIVTLLVGLADDVWKIKPLTKLAGQTVAATVFVVVSGVTIDYFGNIFGTGDLRTGPFAPLVTIFAIVSVMNALNLSDGLNGLAGGISILAFSFVMFFALIAGHVQVAYLSIALIGSILGFLYFNMYPAKIFMGDTGALSLGYLLSTLCILLAYDNPIPANATQPVSLALILCLPILDTLFVMLRRLANRQSPAHADNRHLHHALLALNFSQSAAVSILYLLMLAFCSMAVAFRGVPEWIQFLSGFELAVLILGGMTYLQHIGYKVRLEWIYQETHLEQLPLYKGLSDWIHQSSRTASVLIPVVLILPVVSFPSIQSTTSLISFLTGSLILIMFPWKEQKDRTGWMHGLIYLATFIVLVQLNLNGPSWTPIYLQYVTLLVSIWVGFQLIFKNHTSVFLTSSFEMLMIMLAWAVPLATQAFDFEPQVQRLLLHSCIESIPFLLAMKIIIRSQPNAARTLISGIAATFMLIGVRQFVAPFSFF